MIAREVSGLSSFVGIGCKVKGFYVVLYVVAILCCCIRLEYLYILYLFFIYVFISIWYNVISLLLLILFLI